jgi:hypothetical protein
MTSDTVSDAGAGFARDRRGSVAIIFAAVIIPVIGIVAAAIDLGRAATVRSTLQTAVSAAAESASKHLGQDRDVIDGKVQAMLSANLPRELAELPHKVRVPNDNSWVEVVMEAKVPTSLMGVVGVAEIAVEASGFARPVTFTVPGVDIDAVARGGELERSAAGAIQALAGGKGRIPTLPPIKNSEDLRAAAGVIAERLKELEAATGGAPHGLPPEVAAELERMMRDVGRTMR